MDNDHDYAASLIARMEREVRAELGTWLASAAELSIHRGTCPSCRRHKTGASRSCTPGRHLRRAERAAKRSANLAAEDLGRIVGFERINQLGAEAMVRFRPVSGG
jgi:hypothetical protein